MKLDLMNTEIPSYNDVCEHPVHWHGVLKETQGDTFTLLKYGPWLSDFSSQNQKLSDVKNDLFRFMCLFSRIVREGNPISNITHHFVGVSYKQMKASMMNIIRDSKMLNDRYRDIAYRFVDIIIDNIRKKQRETYSLESTIIDSSPIVTYQERYSGFSANLCEKMRKEIPDMTIESAIESLYTMLTTPVCLTEIFAHKDNFLDIDDPSNAASVACFPAHPNSADIYFALCYLIECKLTGKVEDPFKSYSKLSTEFSSIIRGEETDIPAALESLETMMGK